MEKLDNDALEDVSGGANGRITMGAGTCRNVYCPWCKANETVGDWGRTTGTFGKVKLTNAPLMWCYKVSKYFLGPCRNGTYYAYNGMLIQ